MKDSIVEYLINQYNPDSIIIYGSYADGTATVHSDFDALIIADSDKTHDETVVNDVLLDVFIYSAKIFEQEYDPEDFIQIYQGVIEMDKHGAAKKLKERVVRYIDEMPMKSTVAVKQELEWCKKMFMRTERGDAEGFFRWHWLLVDSLEIYDDIVHTRYFGPKKALRNMAESDPDSYVIYKRAVQSFTQESLSDWICHMEALAVERGI